MRTWIVVVALVGASGVAPVSAQAPAEPRIWTVLASAGLALTSGNTDTSSVNAAYEVAYDPQTRNVIKSDGLWIRGKTGDTLTTSRLGLSIRDERAIASRAFVFAQNQYLRDEFKSIDYLLAPTGGLGYKLPSAGSSTLYAVAYMSMLRTQVYLTREQRRLLRGDGEPDGDEAGGDEETRGEDGEGSRPLRPAVVDDEVVVPRVDGLEDGGDGEDRPPCPLDRPRRSPPIVGEEKVDEGRDLGDGEVAADGHPERQVCRVLLDHETQRESPGPDPDKERERPVNPVVEVQVEQPRRDSGQAAKEQDLRGCDGFREQRVLPRSRRLINPWFGVFRAWRRVRRP